MDVTCVLSRAGKAKNAEKQHILDEAPRTVAVWVRIGLINLALTAAAIRPDAKIRFGTVVPSGISFVLDNGATPEKHQIETMIAGVAVFDYDDDGLLDIYFVNGAAIPGLENSNPALPNRLYRNHGGGKPRM